MGFGFRWGVGIFQGKVSHPLGVTLFHENRADGKKDEHHEGNRKPEEGEELLPFFEDESFEHMEKVSGVSER